MMSMAAAAPRSPRLCGVPGPAHHDHQAPFYPTHSSHQLAHAPLHAFDAHQSFSLASEGDLVDKLKLFLATAPSAFADFDDSTEEDDPVAVEQRRFLRFPLPNGEYVSCIYWNGLFHVTGTDIVRILLFRFKAFGRPVVNLKKFEEGVFSDLRNLKAGTDATLELPKSAFLDILFRYGCIRTQKKQKVFYWFSVPHDQLFIDALERDLKREKLCQESTTVAVAEPALSFTYDASMSLHDQIVQARLSAVPQLFTLGFPSSQPPPQVVTQPTLSRDPQSMSYQGRGHSAPLGPQNLVPHETASHPQNEQQIVTYPQAAPQYPMGPQVGYTAALYPHAQPESPVENLNVPTSAYSTYPSPTATTISTSSHNHSQGQPSSPAWRYRCPLYPCGALFEDFQGFTAHMVAHRSNLQSMQSNTEPVRWTDQIAAQPDILDLTNILEAWQQVSVAMLTSSVEAIPQEMVPQPDWHTPENHLQQAYIANTQPISIEAAPAGSRKRHRSVTPSIRRKSRPKVSDDSPTFMTYEALAPLLPTSAPPF